MEINGEGQRLMKVSFNFFERVIGPVIVGFLCWISYWVWSANERVIRVELRVESLIDDVSKSNHDRYTSSDAIKDLRLVDMRITSMEQRVSVLEAGSDN